jgi:hypothetical protein
MCSTERRIRVDLKIPIESASSRLSYCFPRWSSFSGANAPVRFDLQQLRRRLRITRAELRMNNSLWGKVAGNERKRGRKRDSRTYRIVYIGKRWRERCWLPGWLVKTRILCIHCESPLKTILARYRGCSMPPRKTRRFAQPRDCSPMNLNRSMHRLTDFCSWAKRAVPLFSKCQVIVIINSRSVTAIFSFTSYFRTRKAPANDGPHPRRVLATKSNVYDHLICTLTNFVCFENQYVWR